MSKTQEREPPLTLEDYSDFQYMLARPSITRRVVKEITTFIFYEEPHDLQKEESEHKVMVRGDINVLAYYVCCLWLLPSHILGMSKWISATDCINDIKDVKEGTVLRRLQNAYFHGLVHVDARHVATTGYDESPSFRLVEYVDGSLVAWFIVDAFYAIFVAVILRGMQMLGYLSQTSMNVVASVWITMQAMEYMYRLQFW